MKIITIIIISAIWLFIGFQIGTYRTIKEVQKEHEAGAMNLKLYKQICELKMNDYVSE